MREGVSGFSFVQHYQHPPGVKAGDRSRVAVLYADHARHFTFDVGAATEHHGSPVIARFAGGRAARVARKVHTGEIAEGDNIGAVDQGALAFSASNAHDEERHNANNRDGENLLH